MANIYKIPSSPHHSRWDWNPKHFCILVRKTRQHGYLFSDVYNIAYEQTFYIILQMLKIITTNRVTQYGPRCKQ